VYVLLVHNCGECRIEVILRVSTRQKIPKAKRKNLST
jgi:hypothetical protein